jgi:uncharacterized protein
MSQSTEITGPTGPTDATDATDATEATEATEVTDATVAGDRAPLDALLARLQAFGWTSHYEWLDGAFTALAVAPPLAPELWLPWLFDGHFERCFADPMSHAEAAAVVLARIEQRRQELSPALIEADPDILHFEPWVAEWTEEDIAQLVQDHGVSPKEAHEALQFGNLWTSAFLETFQELGEHWPAGSSRERAPMLQLFECIAVVSQPETSDLRRSHVAKHWKGRAAPTPQDLFTEALFAVQELRLWWAEVALRPAPRVADVTPGRNDPCPCGSGKKFKKCHGVAA